MIHWTMLPMQTESPYTNKHVVKQPKGSTSLLARRKCTWTLTEITLWLISQSEGVCWLLRMPGADSTELILHLQTHFALVVSACVHRRDLWKMGGIVERGRIC